MKKMKKILLLLLVIIMVLPAFVGCGGSPAEQESTGGEESTGLSEVDEPFVIRFAFDLPSGTLFSTFPDTFAELVNTDPELKGKVEVQLFPAGQLYAANETVDAVLRGDAEMVQLTSWYTNAISPKGVIFDLPFLFNDIEHMKDFIYNTDLIQEIYEPFPAAGAYVKGANATGAYGILTSDKEVIYPEDTKGLKVRSVGDGSLTFKVLGASPIDLKAADIFTGLQRGTIDGADIGATSIRDRKLYEVADHYLNIFNHSTLTLYLANKDFWDQIPADIRERLDSYCKMAEEAYSEAQIPDEQEALQFMQDNGMKVHTATEEEHNLWYEATKSVYDKPRDTIKDNFIDNVIEWAGKE